MNYKLTKIAVVAILPAVLVLAAVAFGQQSGGSSYVPDQIIVKVREATPVPDREALRSSVDATIRQRFTSIGAELWDLGSVSVEDAIGALGSDPRVEYVEPNYIWQVDQTFPNDPQFSQLWGLHNTGQTGGIPDADIDAPEAWDIETGDTVLVGVIDTGVDWLHPELADEIWTNPGEIPNNNIDDDGNGYIDDIRGWDWVNNDNNPMDDHSHGTHVSGTIAAIGNNGVGVVGVSWHARIMPLKFLSAGGSGSTANAILAVEYGTMMGARVTNNSWGGGGFSQALKDAIEAAGNAGGLFVAAAGNSSIDNDINPHYPSSYDLDNIIAVASTDHNDLRSSFSNWGRTSVDLGAPGSSIYSTIPGNSYGFKSGTSMATPHVVGAVSLLWAAAPLMDHLEVKAHIMDSVDLIPSMNGITVSGGRLNVFTMVSGLDSIPPDPVADLAILQTGSNTATLQFTASGDDGSDGTATMYDIRYSPDGIYWSNFDDAPQFSGPPPQPSGSTETIQVTGLDFDTSYFFALKVIDEQSNTSYISNLPSSATTLGVPAIAFEPDTLSDDLFTGGSSTHTITIRNTAVGTLDFTFPGLPGWVTATPSAGRVYGGESQEVELEVNATGLSGGDYHAAIEIASNDPVNPSVFIDARLHVTSAPDVTADPNPLDFGSHFIGASVVRTLTVSNIGKLTLNVTGITTDNSEFVVSPSGFSIVPGASRNVDVGYNPVTVGPIMATLTIASNDPDHPNYDVELLAEGLIPPDIAVSPLAMSADLLMGQTSTETLLIENTGGSDLIFEIGSVISSASVDRTRVIPDQDLRTASGAWLDVTRQFAKTPGAYNYEHEPDPELARASASEVNIGKSFSLDDLDILIVYTGDVSEIQSHLLAFPDISVVDVFSASGGTPSLALLEQYHTVMVATNTSPVDPDGLGDVLADYVDGGGGVVITLAAFVPGFQVGGRFLTGGYMPFVNGFGPIGAGTLAGYDAGHPIMSGVTTVFGDLLAGADLAPGAEWVADWSIGEPFIATMGERVVGVNIFVAGSGYWSGDLPLILHNSALFAGGLGSCWLSLDPTEGVVPAGTSAMIDVTFDATSNSCVSGGAFADTVLVTSNDPDEPEVPVTMALQVTDAPDITLSDSELDFGGVFVGGSAKDTITVTNTGTLLLNVSNIVSSHPDYSTDVSGFALAPSVSQDVVVTFAPTSVAPLPATLAIVSNDPDENPLIVPLQGAGLDPPVIGVSPTALADTLLTGQTSDHTVTISNTGGNDLLWETKLALVEASALQQEFTLTPPSSDPTEDGDGEVRPPLGNRTEPITAALEDLTDVYVMWDRSHGQGPSSSWSVILGDLTARGATVLENSATITPELLSNFDIVWLIDMGTWAASEVTALANWVQGGGGVIFETDQAETVANTLLSAMGAGITYNSASAMNGTTTNIFPHPTTENVNALLIAGSLASLVPIVPPAGRLANDAGGTTGFAAYSEVGSGRVVAVADEIFGDFAIGGDDNQLFGNQIADWLASGVSWLSIEPESGTVAPGGSMDATVRFDAAGLASGDYVADIVIQNNDPITPDVPVNTVLTAIGAPDIAVSDTTLDYGGVFIGGTSDMTITVANEGVDPLNVAIPPASHPDFSANPTGFIVPPNSEQFVVVTYAPTSSGPAAGTLTLASDDPDEGTFELALSGEGVVPPVIGVSPSSMLDSLFTGETSTHVLTVSNTGGSDLIFEIGADETGGPVATVSSMKLHLPRSSGEFPRGTHAPSLGTAPEGEGAAPAGVSPAPIATAAGSAFGIESSFGQVTKFRLNQPEVLDFFGSVSTFYWAGDFGLGDNSFAYAISDLNQLVTVDTTTGTQTVIGSVGSPGGGEIWTGLTVDPSDGQFYATSSDVGISSLYQIDPVGPTATRIGTIGFGGVIAVAADEDGNLFGYDIVSDVLISIDKATGIGTSIGSLGFDANFGQGMAFDPVSGLLYLAAFNNSTFRAELRVADTTTGNTTFVGVLGGTVPGGTVQLGWAAMPGFHSVRWLGFNPSGGTVPPGASLDVEVTFDAFGLLGGTYSADIVVESNDPLSPETTVPALLDVTGAPDIAFSDTLLDFGGVFVGGSKMDTLRVSNVGTDLLSVTSITTNLSDYTVDASSFDVAPGAYRDLSVTFTPTSVSPLPAVLTIQSNDIDEPTVVVTLQGEGLDPPVIGVSPVSFSDTLLSGGTSSHVLSVSNTGGNDLEFAIRIVDVGAGAGATASVRTRATRTQPDPGLAIAEQAIDNRSELAPHESAGPPVDFDATVPPPEPAAILFEDDFEDGDFDGWINAGPGSKEVTNATAADGTVYSYHEFNSASGHSNGIYRNIGPIHPGYVGLYVRSSSTVRHDAYCVIRNSTGRDAIWFYATALGRFYVNGDVGGDESVPYVANQWYHIEFKDIDFTSKTFDYYVDGTLIKADISFRNASTVNDMYRMDLYTFDGGIESWWDEIFISTGEEPTKFVSVDPLTGTVPPGTTMELDVRFDSKGLPGGTYNAVLELGSNDPITPSVGVLAQLEVIGAPDIALSDTLLDFGQAFVGATVERTVSVSNGGVDPLVVGPPVMSHADFTTDAPTGFTVNPGQTRDVVVMFAPSEVTLRSESLTFLTNDPDEGVVVVALTGEGLEPPVIGVSPVSVSDTLLSGEMSSHVLSISNTGGNDLEFAIVITEVTAGAGGTMSVRARATRTPPDPGLAIIAEESVPNRIPDLAPEESAGPPVNFVATVPPPEPAAILFEDDFEDGDFDGWIDNGPGSKEVTNATAADGSIYSYHEYNSASGHFNGIYHDFGAIQPGYVGFYIRSSSAATNDAYCVIRDSGGRDAIWFFARSSGRLYINADTGGDESVPYVADTWYHIEFKDIDFTSKTFDYYVDETLIKADISFRQASSVNDLYRMDLYTYDGGVESWWDEIFVSTGEEPTKFVSVEPVTGTVPPGTALDLVVTFDAMRLLGGTYTAFLNVTSNDPITPSLGVLAQLEVIGVPDIEVSDTLLSFGQQFVGTSQTQVLTISNEGTDELTVSGFSIDHGDYDVDSAGFVLAIGEMMDVDVIFHPTSPGVKDATLTIHSDDPDESAFEVALEGEGLVPPVMGVSPGALADTLLTNETSLHTLTIANTGGSDLLWDIATQFTGGGEVVASSEVFSSSQEIREDKTAPAPPSGRPHASEIFTFAEPVGGSDAPADPAAVTPATGDISPTDATPLEAILANLNAGYGAVTGIIPNRYDFTEGETGTSILDGGNDMYDGGNILYTDLGGPTFYSNNVIQNSPFYGPSGRYFTRKYPGLFVLVADMEGVDYFDITGNLGADGSGAANGAILQATVAGREFIGFVKRVYGAGDPSVNHLVIIEHDPSLNHEFATNTNDDYHRVLNLSGSDRIYYLLYAGANGFYIDNTATLAIMETFLSTLGLVPEWLSVSPSSGVVPPGASADVQVTFDATGLEGGNYPANLAVTSNDPLATLVDVPVYMKIIGVPDIAVSDTLMSYGVVFVGGSAGQTLTVSNEGTDDLIVSAITSDHGDFAADSSAFVLGIGEMADVVVTFSPSSPGVKTGTLTIDSNDPDESVFVIALAGEGVLPPVIGVSPDSLGDTLSTGGTSLHALTIANTGVADLTWTARVESDDVIPENEYTLTAPSTQPSDDGDGNTVVPPDGARTAPITVLLKNLTGIRIMWEQSHGQVSRGGWSTIIGDLVSRGASITTNTATITPDVLAPYHILWLVDCDPWSTDEVNALVDWVGLGGGLLIEGDQSVVTFNTILTALGAGVSLSGGNGSGGASTNIYPHESTAGVNSIFVSGPLSRLGSVAGPGGNLFDDRTGVPIGAYSTSSSGNIVVMSDEIFTNQVIGQVDNQLFANQVFDWLARTRWVFVAPTSGTVGSGSSVDLTVTFEAGELPGGKYSGDIVVTSNDPITPEVVVPVHLLVDTSGVLVATTSDADERSTPKEYALHDNYPNPFNPTTTIRYEVPKGVNVRLTIYNVKGERVRDLVNEFQTAGRYDVVWDATSSSGDPVATGVYFYKLRAGDFVRTKKMILMK